MKIRAITILAAVAAYAAHAGSFTTSPTAPSGDSVLESFNAQDFKGDIKIGSMGPKRVALSGTLNRMAGQSLTINKGGPVKADSITFRNATEQFFFGGSSNAFELYIVANSVELGRFTYDLSEQALMKGDYVTFDLDGIELESGVEYEFQMYFGELSAENTLNFERDQGGDSYAGGVLFSHSDAKQAIQMPQLDQWLGGDSDMTFFLEGTVE